MKVLLLNASPRGNNSSTLRMLKPFATGMYNAGAEVNLVNLVDFDINPCTGCYVCWSSTPGKCYINDDMDKLIKLFTSSDIVVYGTPIHTYIMSALLKTFIDRTFPIHGPRLMNDERNKGVTTLIHLHSKPTKLFLVANSGFPEYVHFEPISFYFRHLAKMLNMEFVGEILRPMGEILKRPSTQTVLRQYYELLEVCGFEVIKYGKMSEESNKRLNSEWILTGTEGYIDIINLHYQHMQEKVRENKEKKNVNNSREVEES